MENPMDGGFLVSATIENLADLFEVGRGRRSASEVRRIVVPDAVVHPEVFGLLMPLNLVEQLGLEPVRTRWVSKLLEAGRPIDLTRPVPHRAAVLKIQGRECTTEVGAIADHLPIVIGRIPLHALGWVIGADRQSLIDDPASDFEDIQRIVRNLEHGVEDMVDIF